MKLNLLLWLCFCAMILVSDGKKAGDINIPAWTKKDIRDYNDADMERLFDQWELLKETKTGKTLITFVSVTGNPTKDEAETVTKLWQTSLWNNQIQAERYMVDDSRAIFLFRDGAQAWEAKDFLVDQERCKSVTIENKIYNGKYSDKKDEL